jgi:hypothetical protein
MLSGVFPDSRVFTYINILIYHSMDNIEHKSEENHKHGGWGVFIAIIAAVVAILVSLKVFLNW